MLIYQYWNHPIYFEYCKSCYLHRWLFSMHFLLSNSMHGYQIWRCIIYLIKVLILWVQFMHTYNFVLTCDLSYLLFCADLWFCAYLWICAYLWSLLIKVILLLEVMSNIFTPWNQSHCTEVQKIHSFLTK